MAHVIKRTQSSISFLTILKLTTDTVGSFFYPLILFYKRHKTRKLLTELPMSVREDVGLNYDEIERIVRAIK